MSAARVHKIEDRFYMNEERKKGEGKHRGGHGKEEFRMKQEHKKEEEIHEGGTVQKIEEFHTEERFELPN